MRLSDAAFSVKVRAKEKHLFTFLRFLLRTFLLKLSSQELEGKKAFGLTTEVVILCNEWRKAIPPKLIREWSV